MKRLFIIQDKRPECMRMLLHIALLMTLSMTSHARVEYKKFNDPEKEQDYQSLIQEMRCLVCQNQTIADSSADLAKDLRRQVHEMLEQDKSRGEIVDFMTERYGDFVLYNPPFKIKTGALWLGPLVFLLIGLWVVYWVSSRKKAQFNRADEEDKASQSKAKSLLNDGERH